MSAEKSQGSITQGTSAGRRVGAEQAWEEAAQMSGSISSHKPGCLTPVLAVMVLMGIALIVGPWFIPDGPNGPLVPVASKSILAAFGAAMALISAILVIMTRLYRKTSTNEAFVRTGVGGRRTVIDGGAVVIPVVHDVVPVSLETFKLEVDRTAGEALITADSLRADVKAVFYVRVQKDKESVEQAATSLGANSGNSRAVQTLIFEKLVSALRTVAAGQTLADLNTKRAQFAEGVQRIVEADLKANGLYLESVTISNLDQAPLSAMRPEENVFDAQGRRTIAEIVQAQRVATNIIERRADQEVTMQDVKTAQYIAEQEVIRAKALAEAESNRKIAAAEAEQKAQTVAAEQNRLAGIAKVESEREVDLAGVAKAKAVQIANIERERVATVAGVEKTKAVEIATRDQQIAIAEKEKQRAQTLARQAEAINEQTAKEQEVQTTEAVATAERQRQQSVIAKQAQADQTRIERNMEADVAAYEQVKHAEAEQTAAEKQAIARIRLAEAEKESATLKAEGERAVQMVPVTVAREQVGVQDAQVTVKIRDLEGQAKYETIARDLQIELAKITAERDAKIAIAKAMGEVMASADMKVYADAGAAQRMLGAIMQGQSIGEFARGAEETMPQGIKDAAMTGGAAIGATIAAVIKKLTGVDIDPARAEAAYAKQSHEPVEATASEPAANAEAKSKKA